MPLPQRVGLVGLEQKKVEGRWAVGAVSETIGPIISQGRQSVGCGRSSGDVKVDWGQAVWTRKGGRREAESHACAACR